ncbi:MAG: DNA-binding NtrC family response regulator [Bradymonadia bacterium]|jgi:DNA-binding NtrC family response regulator
MQHRILIVDDDPLTLQLAQRMLRPLDATCETFDQAEDVVARLGDVSVSLVLTDLVMDGMDGEELLRFIKARHPTVPVIVMTTHSTVDTAVRLMRHGAVDFVTKPLDKTRLRAAVRRALDESSLRGEVAELREALVQADSSRTLIGDAPAFRRLRDRLPLAARSDAPVLLLGETGSGKELVARAVHDLSSRAGKPFVAVNCGALSGNLLDSELFGHVRGAFTDARRDKVGLVEEADGGTLFLDEIGDMPTVLQVKMLRFLQESEVRRIGSNTATPVDVRIIAATHRDLASAVDEGDFREDLYYRLNVVPLRLPPLRGRLDDVPPLARHFLHRYSRGTSQPNMQLSPEALERLKQHDWPGNVRELENVIRRAMVFAPSAIITPDLLEFDRTHGDADPEPAPVTVDLSVALKEAKSSLIDEFQSRYVRAALRANGGVIAQAARQAGKDRKSFWELMQKYAINSDAYR